MRAVWITSTDGPDGLQAFAQAAAHRRILERRNTGKIILTP